ncbi:MAG: nucleotidyltransferase domain-containing protein [Bacteroidia bacterium]|nr:nucleotidyltransferase domain-containing protein [Bacteroidia bacterium]
MTKPDEINLLVKKIKSSLQIKSIILFGSYAYGNPSNESDIDLCIVTNESRRQLDIIRDIRKLLMPFITKPLDLLVYGEDEFNYRAAIRSTLEYKIKTEGVIL